jgi:hypothetical protein
MSFTKLKAALHNQIARWTLLLALLTTIQTYWYLFAEKMPLLVYVGGATGLTIAVQVINIVYGKKIAAYKTSLSTVSDDE